MRIMSIGTYPSISYRGGNASLSSEEQRLVNLATKELERIEAQGKRAGTDAAWWRPEFLEARSALEAIARSEEHSKPENHDYGIMNFHSFGDEDGLI